MLNKILSIILHSLKKIPVKVSSNAEVQDGRKTGNSLSQNKSPRTTTTTTEFSCVLSLRRSIAVCIDTATNEKM